MSHDSESDMIQRRKKTDETAHAHRGTKLYLMRTTTNFDLIFADVSIVCNAQSTMSDNQEQRDFEFQLQSERLYAEKVTEESWNKQNTYTDPSDGTVYEWDAEKNGWFPKVSVCEELCYKGFNLSHIHIYMEFNV